MYSNRKSVRQQRTQILGECNDKSLSISRVPSSVDSVEPRSWIIYDNCPNPSAILNLFVKTNRTENKSSLKVIIIVDQIKITRETRLYKELYYVIGPKYHNNVILIIMS